MDYPATDIQCQMSYEIFPRFFPIHNQGHHFCILGQDSRPLVSGIESQFYLQNRLYLFITLQMEVTVSSIRIIVDSLCSQIISGPLNKMSKLTRHSFNTPINIECRLRVVLDGIPGVSDEKLDSKTEIIYLFFGELPLPLFKNLRHGFHLSPTFL